MGNFMAMQRKLLSLLVLMFLSVACIEEDTPKNASIINVGDDLPEFTVCMSDGTCVSRDSLVGHNSVIVFFNTSCADCRHELPCVDSLYRAFSDSNEFRFICIARDEERESIENFWEQENLAIPYSPQQGREVYNLFANSIIPRIYICSKDGVVRFAYGDSNMPSFAQLASVLTALQ